MSDAMDSICSSVQLSLCNLTQSLLSAYSRKCTDGVLSAFVSIKCPCTNKWRFFSYDLSWASSGSMSFRYFSNGPVALNSTVTASTRAAALIGELTFQISIRRPFPELQAHVGEHKFDLSVGANSFASQKVRLVGNLLKLRR